MGLFLIEAVREWPFVIAGFTFVLDKASVLSFATSDMDVLDLLAIAIGRMLRLFELTVNGDASPDFSSGRSALFDASNTRRA